MILWNKKGQICGTKRAIFVVQNRFFCKKVGKKLWYKKGHLYHKRAICSTNGVICTTKNGQMARNPLFFNHYAKKKYILQYKWEKFLAKWAEGLWYKFLQILFHKLGAFFVPQIYVQLWYKFKERRCLDLRCSTL